MTNRGFLATAAVGAALLTGACGGGDQQGGDKPKKADVEAAALKFSRCMRAHGVNMPDPEISSDGSKVRVLIGGAKGTAKFNPRTPAFKAAEQACRKYMEAVRPRLTPAQQQEAQQQVLETLRCMRRHGVDIPDSAASGGGLKIGPESGVDPRNPAFRRAEKACMKGPRGSSLQSGPKP
jgi:hypothetical protein